MLEVDTPVLSRHAVSDPHIESIEVSTRLDGGHSRFLRTSPEYSMKRLLCAGYPDIYEIGKVFRDAECGRHHQPEFTLVEWYRLGFGLQEIMRDAIDFISCLADAGRFKTPPLYLNYRDVFRQFASIDCSSVVTESLDLVLVEKILPEFAADRLTVLYHYPAAQAALARLCPGDSSVADRFEVFVGSLELANGYVELVDADEQTRRFENDQAHRAAAGKPRRPIDETFIAAIRAGLPPCAGVAVGFDRVLMLNEGTDDIRQVQSFPFDATDHHDQ